MTKQEYMLLADDCLARVAAWLEEFDPDEVDYSTTDGMVSIEFPDRTRYVLNRQSGNDQMWFAAGVSAWHYAWDEARREWRDDRDGHPLLERIAREVGAKIGRGTAVIR